MKGRELTKEEINHWESVFVESFRDVLLQIVKANLTDPVNMGKMYASFAILDYSSRIMINKKQNSMIDWETIGLHECMIREMVCYKYLHKCALGVSLEEDAAITKQWNEFHAQNREEVDKYIQDVCLGFQRHMRSIHEKYTDLEHPVFTNIDRIDKQNSEKKD